MVLLLSIVGGLALFSMATVFTDFLLMYVMPLRSYYAADKYEYTRDYSDLRDEQTLIRQQTKQRLLLDSSKNICLSFQKRDSPCAETIEIGIEICRFGDRGFPKDPISYAQL